MEARFVLFALLLPVAAAPDAVGGDDPKAVVRKAIAALGGEANLTKLRIRAQTTRGTVHFFGQSVAFTAEARIALPDRFRGTRHLQFKDKRMELEEVFAGKEGWVVVDGVVKDLDAAGNRALADELHVNWVMTLAPVLGSEFSLANAAAKSVDGTLAPGVRVSAAGKPDVTLYFHPESGRSVKVETRATDPNTGKLVFQELYLKDYQDRGGVWYPMRSVLYQDGNKFAEEDVVEVRFFDRFDDKAFAKPQAAAPPARP